MKAFDTDTLTQILRGNPAYAERVALIPVAEQSLPILAAEEVLRGRLNTIRQAEAGKAKITIDQAYAEGHSGTDGSFLHAAGRSPIPSMAQAETAWIHP
jgi:hypothetical protein